MRTEPQPWRPGKTYTEAEVRWAVALIRNAAEQLDMLEQLLGRTP
jgi:hypothetical protein